MANLRGSPGEFPFHSDLPSDQLCSQETDIHRPLTQPAFLLPFHLGLG